MTWIAILVYATALAMFVDAMWIRAIVVGRRYLP